MQSQVFTGARSIFKLGVSVVGYALSVSGSTAINYQPLRTLGNLAVTEHAPIEYSVELSAQLSRIVNHTRLKETTAKFPARVNEVPNRLMKDQSSQIMPAFAMDGLPILTSGEMVSYVQDTVTTENLYTIKGVKGSSKGWESSASGAVAENCQFVARICNENGENTGPLANAA
jgi:hypothetical protein